MDITRTLGPNLQYSGMGRRNNKRRKGRALSVGPYKATQPGTRGNFGNAWGHLLEEIFFKETTSTAMVIQCPKPVTKFILNLRNEQETIPGAVLLNSLIVAKEQPQVGKGKDSIEHQTPHPLSMKLIIWNARRANSAKFRCQCDTMVQTDKPSILVLLETEMTDHKNLTEALKFDTHIQSAANGLSWAIVIMWKEDTVKLDSLTSTQQGIHVMASELCQIAETYNSEWVIGGDFNEVTQAKEKLGGLSINNARTAHFRECLNRCGMMDLAYKGCTWTNKRYTNRDGLILERLDRCVANTLWINQYLEALVTYLPRTKSDHHPLLINLKGNMVNNANMPFGMEPMWCGHPSFQGVVKCCFDNTNTLGKAIDLFQEEVKRWNKSTFGNIFINMKRILAKLDGMHPSKIPILTITVFSCKVLENNLILNYDNFLKAEERGGCLYWFFHCSTLNCRRRNKITSLKDEAGTEYLDNNDIRDHTTNYFINLYTTVHSQFSNPKDREQAQTKVITQAFKDTLDLPITDLEILQALKSFKPLKAPGADGLHSLFYHKYGDLVGDTTRKRLTRDQYLAMR
ncbi:hypothetical protein KY284_032057 [Solanum tuberosum]|nr:hypothetical protein KY284_032057 [Solanum tuberosum]